MSKINKFKLVTGIVLLCFFMILSFLGPYLAPYDIDHSKKIERIGDQLVAAPFPPSKEYILGTDKWGYDILTLLMYGAKYTIITVFVVGLLRVLIGAGWGIFRALSAKEHITKNKNRFTIFSSIPHFILIYFIMLGININSSLSVNTLMLIQVVLMVVFGISGVYQVMFSKTMELRKNQYILAAHTLGGSRLHILKKHISPFLGGNLLFIFVSECIQVLHLLGQLGIFNLFFGGTIMYYDPPVYISVTHEWSGLIGQSRSFLYHSQWIVLYPLLAYLLLLFTFYLISTGVNEWQTSKYRRRPYI